MGGQQRVSRIRKITKTHMATSYCRPYTCSNAHRKIDRLHVQQQIMQVRNTLIDTVVFAQAGPNGVR